MYRGKKSAKYAGYVLFVILFVIMAFEWILDLGYESLVLIPAAFLFGMIGYWLGGVAYSVLQEK
ncbi:MAG: hypothetical protein AWU58_869 [Methanohalophilus sp. T328-1]|uniref:hypothetical protein n=1 Tax=Methanohalophilus sp. DAL1 TaxID=1864608 RepID=UPI000794CD00|nr:hypothetical protein [Methanohalophilus sp. DAL1]KXS46057.1 MAG: hypothetical protein AWU58_869 [Methanohalophilus sp. T328-1]OBZ35835.1 MAG: hypothetical protein A9957_05765 [Methanohalophilus sp. DAL1]